MLIYYILITNTYTIYCFADNSGQTDSGGSEAWGIETQLDDIEGMDTEGNGKTKPSI